MVLRIDFFLLIALVGLFGCIFMVEPTNVDAVESNSSKEVLFKNFSLIELNEEGISNQVISSEAIKYKAYFYLDDLNITYENIHYFKANNLLYDLKSKAVSATNISATIFLED